ncbi:MAG TPA: ABC transporter permease [Puia sp.]|nr:ABC transporter permease [Puia sp.]
MLRQYLRIAIRNLAKQKALTFINVSGLSLGMACFSLILLFAVSEFNFDSWHKKASRIYRVNEVYTLDNGRQSGDAGLGMPAAPAFRKDFPDVEAAVRVTPANERLIKGKGDAVRLKLCFADTGFFSVFSFSLLAGNTQEALRDPHSIVLTRSKALQLFGTDDAVGKTVQIKFDSVFRPFTVSAVAADMPVTTSIRFDVMGSFDYLFLTDSNRVRARNGWNMTFGDQTYVLLRPESKLADEPDRLQIFRWRYFPEEEQAWRKDKKVQTRFQLEPLARIHTDAVVDAGSPEETTDPKNIWILISIAAGILMIAAINFTTLAIARSAGRAKEIGVRKVIGGLRRQLILQFITESMVLSVISAAAGLLLAYILLPWFIQLSGRPMQLSFIRHPQLAWLLAGVTVTVGLTAGLYPAFVLSGFHPIQVLRSRVKLGGSNYFTRGLVTVQFILSIGLMIATVVILRQVDFMRSRNLGLIKENTIAVRLRDVDPLRAFSQLKLALAADRLVMGVTASEIKIGDRGQMGDLYDFGGTQSGVIEYPVEAGFVPVMGMRLLAGRNFDPAIHSDTVGNVIVNETLVRKEFGLTPANAIGKRFMDPQNHQYKTIIGVTADFNFEPLTRKVRDQMFTMPAQFRPGYAYVHLRGGDPSPAIEALGGAWRRIAPAAPFEYSFLDEDFDSFYRSETRWGAIISRASGISIFLACLGLFGLAALATANRLKEIGIRRVLGASVMEIIGLLTGGFLPMVMVAALVASPLAWYFMNKWLQGFAYRTSMGWATFGLTALVALSIAYLTIGIQAFRAARTNPVKNLRTD